MWGFRQSTLLRVPVRVNRWLKSNIADMLWWACAAAAAHATTTRDRTTFFMAPPVVSLYGFRVDSVPSDARRRRSTGRAACYTWMGAMGTGDRGLGGRPGTRDSGLGIWERGRGARGSGLGSKSGNRRIGSAL